MKSILSYKSILSVFLTFGVLVPLILHAQILPPNGFNFDDPVNDENVLELIGQPTVTLDITPDAPAPGERITARVVSFGTDLNRANITWFINGSLVTEGVGLTSYTLQNGSFGSQTTIRAVIATAEGLTLERSVTLTANDVHLIWETDGSVPPLYKGKALYPAQGTVRITAFPELRTSRGTRIDPVNVIYTWSENGRVLGSLSGTGRNTLERTGNILARPLTIGIEARSLDGTQSASRSITIPISEPKVYLYEYSPLLGVRFNKKIDTRLDLTQEEIVIAGFPFYFSGTRSNNTLFDWNVGGEQLFETGANNTVTLRRSNESGSIDVDLDVQHIGKQLQRAETTTRLTF